MISEKFTGQSGVYEQGRNQLSERLWEAWGDMRGSTRRLIRENPSESRLLFYILLSDIIVFTSWSLKTTIAPTLAARDQIPVEIAIYIVTALFVRTAFLYVFSFIAGSFARIAGGTGSWKETRASIFWGALVAAPIGFAIAVFSVLLALLETAFPTISFSAIALYPFWLSIIPFLWFTSAGLAEAHGFRRTSVVFAMMSLIAVAGLAIGLYLRAQGIL